MADPASPFGIYLVDKPAGPTSHDIVSQIRRTVGRGVKVGHAGTLDPFATGLLVVAIGRATRLLQYLTGHDKTYVARVILGAISATGDPEGPITPNPAPLPTLEQIAASVAALPAMTSQLVPVFSAVKVDGEPLHRRVRRGEHVEAPRRAIAIREADLIASDPERTWFDLRVTCSKGTYVRQIAADLGTTLGCGGYCGALRRTRSGALSIDDAVAPDQVPSSGSVDPVRALSLPVRSLDATQERHVLQGRPITVGDGDADQQPVALVGSTGLIGIGHIVGGVIRPKVVLV